MKFSKLFCALAVGLTMTSCSVNKLVTPSVTYQSVRLANPKNPENAKDAEILLNLGISDSGQLYGTIYNQTDEIMVIDQTMSFFVNTDGQSTSYFDPTVQTQTVTNVTSGTSGASVNLGAVGSALGLRGATGRLLSGVNVGGSTTTGQAVANTTYIADQQKVSIGPKGSAQLSKVYTISGIGKTAMKDLITCNNQYQAYKQSPLRFSVCITYSVDGGVTFKKMTTDLYLSSQIAVAVTDGKQIGQSMRELLSSKSDAIYEPWWMIYIPNNASECTVYDSYGEGILSDYQ